MATGPLTQISDVIVPEIFTPYVQQLTTDKSALISSGLVVMSEALSALVAGGGNTFNIPSWLDLDTSDAERVSTDTPHAEFTGGVAEPDPAKIETAQEIAVKLSRNQSWSAAQLTAALAGSDPMKAIGDRVAQYWTRRLQAVTIATLSGVYKDNTANDSGDYTNDISGVYSAGVTDFSAEAFLDTALTMGDSMEDLVAVAVHSVVYNRMQKNNLIDFIQDSKGMFTIPTFLGRRVIVDDNMPSTGNDYESWLFKRGAVLLGQHTPANATETERKAGAGNGGGQDILYSRVEWAIHPAGHAYVGTPASGGPSNAASTNNLDIATSWNRVFPERKQVGIARLITTEA